MATIRDVITGSLRLIEEAGAGEIPSAESINDGLYSLNSMISSWSIQGNLIFTRTSETFTLTGGDASYAIGPTGDFVTTRPLEIEYMTLSSGDVDYTLQELSEQEYVTMALKTVQGIPYGFYYDGNYPNGTIKFYPTPSTNFTISVYSNKPLTESSSVNDTLVSPEGYERALRYNLAVEIAPEYGKQASMSVSKIAVESKNAIRAQNGRNGAEKMRVDDALMMNGRYDVYTDGI